MKDNNWMEAINDITVPEQMEEELLKSCVERKHVKNFKFRYSKMIAVIIGVMLLTTVSTTSYAAVSLYQEKSLDVFFEFKVGQDRIEEIGRELEEIPGVYSIRFVSESEAWESFQKKYLTEEMAAYFEENPLENSYSYRVSVKLDADTKEVRKAIGEIEGIRKVTDLKESKKDK